MPPSSIPRLLHPKSLRPTAPFLTHREHHRPPLLVRPPRSLSPVEASSDLHRCLPLPTCRRAYLGADLDAARKELVDSSSREQGHVSSELSIRPHNLRLAPTSCPSARFPAPFRNCRLWRIGRLCRAPSRPYVSDSARPSDNGGCLFTYADNQTAMPDSPVEPVLKRKRITVACNSCRARKSKVSMRCRPSPVSS